MPTKAQIISDILILGTRFSRTDETRLDEDYIGFKIDQIRVQEIIKEYNFTGVIDQNWLMDFGIIPLYNVNFSDDKTVTHCACDIMKAKIPSIINLTAIGEGNLDLGLKVLSACGTKEYFAYPLEMWRNIPSEHVRSKFNYYQRFGNSIYVNKKVNYLRFYGIPETTDGLFIKNTLPVLSGYIKVGISYTVNSASVTYNGNTYLKNQTFVGVLGVSTYTGSGLVNYANQMAPMTNTDPYPVSSHMARLIVLEFMTKELGIEKQQVADVQDDSIDDVKKQG